MRNIYARRRSGRRAIDVDLGACAFAAFLAICTVTTFIVVPLAFDWLMTVLQSVVPPLLPAAHGFIRG